MQSKAVKILTTDLAILLYLCIGWAVPILKGGRFDALLQEGHLSDLAVLVLIWLGYYMLHYIQTGDLTPPAPVAAKLSLDDIEQIGSAVARRMPRSVTLPEVESTVLAALAAHDHPLPAVPPQAPLESAQAALVVAVS